MCNSYDSTHEMDRTRWKKMDSFAPGNFALSLAVIPSPVHEIEMDTFHSSDGVRDD